MPARQPVVLTRCESSLNHRSSNVFVNHRSAIHNQSSIADPRIPYVVDNETTIAVINGNEDTVEMLRACLQHHGFSAVVTAHVPRIKRGRTDFLAFLSAHDPAVLVYDISIPYEENWRFLQLLPWSEEMQGREVVITTTNKRVLDELVGDTGAIEILGKPYDLEQVVAAVERAIATRGDG